MKEVYYFLIVSIVFFFCFSLANAGPKPVVVAKFAKQESAKKLAGPVHPDSSDEKAETSELMLQPFKSFYNNLNKNEQRQLKKAATKVFKNNKPVDKNDTNESELSILSLLSMIFGILSLITILVVVFFSPLAAFISGLVLGVTGLSLGIVGLIQASSRDQSGKGFAITGIIASGVGIIMSFIGLLIIALSNACDNGCSNSSNNNNNDNCCTCSC